MRRARGFTLIELSIVIIIIGVVAGMSMNFGSGMLESARRTQTSNKIKQIESALRGYRADNNRLPCPADPRIADGATNFGVEAVTAGQCSVGSPTTPPYVNATGTIVEGTVPVRTLNLPDSFMYDGWGRRFAYAVAAAATDINAFTTINPSDSCGMTINNGGGTARTSGAIYVLVSYGSSGHGGYLNNGTRYNSGDINANDKTNCHCRTDLTAQAYTGTYVQRARTEASGDLTNIYDQIVSYKSRWQMLDYDDKQLRLYAGPDLVAGYAGGVGGVNTAYTYNLQCGKLAKLSDLNLPALQNTLGAAFLPNNTALLTYSSAGCLVYPITGSTVGTDLLGTSVPSCPAYNVNNKLALSDNGYLAISITASPWVKLWRPNTTTSFSALAADITWPASPAPDAQPNSLSLTSNFLLVSNSNYLIVAQRSGSGATTSYAVTASQPPGIPASIVSAALSPNEMYIGATVAGAPNSTLYLWKLNDGVGITALPNVTLTGNTSPNGLTFSADGKYLAVGGPAAKNLMIYKIEAGEPPVFTLLADPPAPWSSTAGKAGLSFAFSKDSRYLAMMTADDTAPLVLFRQSSATTYRYIGTQDSAPGGGADGTVAAFAW